MPPLSDDPCNDAMGAGLRSSGLPGEYRKMPSLDMAPTRAKPPCAKCRNKNEMKGMTYIQPEIPASFKPESSYKPPSYPIESGTIYNLSYPGVQGDMMKDCRPKYVHVQDNIRPSSLPFSQDTTFRLSFTGVPGERTVSYKPIQRNMMGCGPMQSITTQRHDYSPKISERPIPVRVSNNIHLSSAKMENATTMMLSYQPVEAERVTSFKPSGTYKKSEYKLEQDTINRLSYQPWEPTPKEVYPWMKREAYRQPQYSMENHTIYKASYLPVDNVEKPIPFKPTSCIGTMGPDKPLSSATVYRESFQDNGRPPPPTPIVRGGNIYLSTQPMSQDTTARLSYTGVGGEKAVPYKPIMKNMMGAGPMQSVTTQRHDFTPKPIVPTESFKPPSTINPSTYKMDDLTTFRASYLPNEPIPKTESFKPSSVYKKPTHALESETINRLSYQPWEPMPKEQYPWMTRPKYEQPTRLMEGSSIYRGSFLPPGTYTSDGNYGQGEEECECQKESTATDDL